MRLYCKRCPRCRGDVIWEWDELRCLACGWNAGDWNWRLESDGFRNDQTVQPASVQSGTAFGQVTQKGTGEAA